MWIHICFCVLVVGSYIRVSCSLLTWCWLTNPLKTDVLKPNQSDLIHLQSASWDCSAGWTQAFCRPVDAGPLSQGDSAYLGGVDSSHTWWCFFCVSHLWKSGQGDRFASLQMNDFISLRLQRVTWEGYGATCGTDIVITSALFHWPVPDNWSSPCFGWELDKSF